MKKVLMVASASGRYTYEYVENILLDIDCKVDIANIDKSDVTPSEDILEFYKKNNVDVFDYRVRVGKRFHRFNLLRSRIRNFFKLCFIKDYDAVHFHYLTEESVAALFFKPRVKCIMTLYGSDFLRAGRIKTAILRKVAKRSNVVTVSSSVTKREAMKRILIPEEKIEIIRFGTNNIESAKEVNSLLTKAECRKEYDLPQEKFVVFCGYNGNPAHRHPEIISELNKLSEEIKNKLCLVFFCSYGLTDEYKAVLKEAMDKSAIECRMFTEFIVGKKLMMFRKCADVMLNLQRTDVLSASMLEHLAVGSIVIKGDWLKYEELEDANAFLLSINDMESLSKCVGDVVLNSDDYYAKAEANKNIIYDLLSWNRCRDKWRKLYE